MKNFILVLATAGITTCHCFSQNVGIGVVTPLHKLHVSSLVSNSGGAAIYSINTGYIGNAILGVSNAANTNAVQGHSNNATGVLGYSNNHIGVAGSTISGTGLYGYSITGYGLDVYGKIKISGGNTNPTNGAVLTSDADGDAVWKPGKIGFRVAGIKEHDVQDNERKKVEFANLSFDDGAVYTPYVSSVTGTTSTFKAPVNGLYHFDVRLRLSTLTLQGFEDTEMTIRRNRGGSVVNVARILGTSGYMQSATIDAADDGIYVLNTNVKLLAGDIIWVEIFQSSGDPCYLVTSNEDAEFSGFLVYAE